ncbi:hypothetical protein Poli38472_013330 [Pythium oligandrum]|uniref:Lysosomal thioesterase PPT2 n=1 Tax=Pythium oligandrum TaxID=41045 RepID=A0A8K1FD20_PYTOL|nr:hypothetical protein Poli38472_013330 [Pythium oligandrum]|eukprot:TMW57856.1 hypothetical protein Poli38472_013330 [Pythium oligandrum]
MARRLLALVVALCSFSAVSAGPHHHRLRELVRVQGHKAVDEHAPALTPKPLPVFFFHGVTANASSGYNYQANLTAEGRVFVALNFCPSLCSVSALPGQVQAAITAVRTRVASDAAFAKGYVFIGHSQGAAIARAVIEEMDDHNVKMFISLAGPQTGVFYGPQPSDIIPRMAFTMRIGPQMIPSFDFSKYSGADYAAGKFQSDFNALVLGNPLLQQQLSVVNLGRSPVKKAWRAVNTFLPVINNVNPCGKGDKQCMADKTRRRRNFLKLKSAHFFGSPADDVVAPWQSSILGQFNDVVTSEDILLNFPLFRVIDMKLTDEYEYDTYGLRSLDVRGGLFLYAVPNVGHSCWVADSKPLGATEICRFQPVYENYIYPLLHKQGWGEY